MIKHQAKTYAHTRRACYVSFVSQAIINNLAPLLFVTFQDLFSISFEAIGLLIMVNFGVQLIVDALSARFADRIGHRPLIMFAHGMCTLGLLLLAILPGALASPYAGLMLAVVIYAIGGGLIEVLASPIVDALPGDQKAGSMSLVHSFYCWGHVAVVLLTTVFLRVFGEGRWQILPVFWAIVPFLNMLRFASVPLAPPLHETERVPLRRLLSSRLFLLAVFLMICAGASEQAMSQWASLFAEKGLQVSKTTGDLLGPCLFAALMGLGRVLFSLFDGKIRLTRALSLCAGSSIACYLAASLFSHPLPALLGCAMAGLAVSLMWPGMVSLGARTFPGAGTALFSLLALGGDIGCSLGPWLTGVVSDAAQKSSAIVSMGAGAGLTAVQTGLKSGLLVAVLFPTMMIVGLFVMARANARGPERL